MYDERFFSPTRFKFRIGYLKPFGGKKRTNPAVGIKFRCERNLARAGELLYLGRIVHRVAEIIDTVIEIHRQARACVNANAQQDAAGLVLDDHRHQVGRVGHTDHGELGNERDRSLITGYAMEYSFDGTTWTAATETISLAGGSVATPSGANLRARVWAINGIGAATKSSASNLVTVASSLFSYTLVNEQGSGTIAAADMPELEISTNFGSSYQTLAAAGYTLSVVSGKLQIPGLAGGYAAGQVLVKYKDGPQEPFFGQDTPGTTDATGVIIKEIYARHATGPRPALGAVTANNLPGVPIVGTRWNIPVTAT